MKKARSAPVVPAAAHEEEEEEEGGEGEKEGEEEEEEGTKVTYPLTVGVFRRVYLKNFPGGSAPGPPGCTPNSGG